MPSQIAATLYTLRDYTKTPADIAATLRKVRAVGYEAVQFSVLGPIAPKELQKMLAGEGLTVCATHTPYERLLNDLSAVIEEHHLWGCRHVAISSPPQSYRTPEGYARFAREASAIARRLAAANLTFSYHNHAFELEKHGGRRFLEVLYEDSDPAVFNAEVDVYWIQHGGGDPAAWIRRMKGRQPLVHLKDMGVLNGQPAMFEVGEGNLNWPEILAACREAGVQWYIVEQDHCYRDPFESIALSLRNLRAMGLT